LKICVDQNLSEYIRDLLPGHEVRHTFELGWDRLANGALLSAAEAAGFEVLVTADQSIPWQNRMAGRRISIVILSTNRWPTIEQAAHQILQALEAIAEGECRVVTLPGPPLRRRPPPIRPER
jgi:predicted nuclease of predicted toxin-antitoxin system